MSRPVVLVALAASIVFAAPAPADVDGGIAPPMRVQLRATPNRAQLGEEFVVEVLVTHPLEQRYELVPPGDLGSFDFGGEERSRVDGTDSATTTFRVKLAAFELGKRRTPDLTFEVTAPQGSSRMPVSGTEVEIVSSLPPDAEDKGANLYDIRGPLELPVRTWRVVYAVLIGLAVALLSYAAYRALTRPKAVAVEAARPKQPLHVRTLTELDALAARNLPMRGLVKEYYFSLSEIVRGYLGELYNFEALECTTPELLEALRTRHTPGLPATELTEFAAQSDFVRYAKSEPGPDECKVVLELAYRIVHATTAAVAQTARAPQPTQPPGEANGRG